MSDRDRWAILSEIVRLNGGKLAGKTRLQKTVYLLQVSGLSLGYDFDYHHYGPYSEGIQDDAGWAEFFGALRTSEVPGNHAIPYTIFESGMASVKDASGYDARRMKSLLEILARHNPVILELAATLHYLRQNGFAARAEQELRLRKQEKASRERIARAKQLLEELGVH